MNKQLTFESFKNSSISFICEMYTDSSIFSIAIWEYKIFNLIIFNFYFLIWEKLIYLSDKIKAIIIILYYNIYFSKLVY